jgi:hypothetical protein
LETFKLEKGASYSDAPYGSVIGETGFYKRRATARHHRKRLLA